VYLRKCDEKQQDTAKDNQKIEHKLKEGMAVEVVGKFVMTQCTWTSFIIRSHCLVSVKLFIEDAIVEELKDDEGIVSSEAVEDSDVISIKHPAVSAPE